MHLEIRIGNAYLAIFIGTLCRYSREYQQYDSTQASSE
jgi:hypothetical protein